MMQIITNVSGFFNDLAEEVRLYLPSEQAVLSSRRGDDPAAAFIEVTVAEDGGVRRARCVASYDGRQTEYELESPAAGDTELAIKRYSKWLAKIAVFRAMRQLMPATHMPWGSLTGIRPTRLQRELCSSFGADEADRMMRYAFDVWPEKLSLVNEIIAVQEPVLAGVTDDSFDVYIGIPYCKTRCLYCSFASSLRTDKTDMRAYLAALEEDIRRGSAMAAENGLRLRGIYVGGGTPTVLTSDELDRLLGMTADVYGAGDLEFTVEAGRPDTIDVRKLNVLKRYGVGRISINPQTMEPRTLELIGRSHSPDDVRRSFEEARAVGFESINMDMICGLPGETEADVERTLSALVTMMPENITVHTLAVKRSSRLRETVERYPMPGAKAVDAMVAKCRRTLDSLGYSPYYMYRQKYMAGNLENVGYSLPGYECVYNIDMMEETSAIIAHGAGSMTKRVFGGEHRVERLPNPKNIERYIEKLPEVLDAKEKLFHSV